MEGNLGTKWDALSSQAHLVNGQAFDEASYWLEVQGESYLGCLDNT